MSLTLADRHARTQADYAQLEGAEIGPVIAPIFPFSLQYLGGYLDASLRIYVQYRPRPYVRMRMPINGSTEIPVALYEAGYGYTYRNLFCIHDVYKVEEFCALIQPYVRSMRPYVDRVLGIARARRVMNTMIKERLLSEEAQARRIFFGRIDEMRDYLRKHPISQSRGG